MKTLIRVEILRHNYSIIRRLYRLGKSEAELLVKPYLKSDFDWEYRNNFLKRCEQNPYFFDPKISISPGELKFQIIVEQFYEQLKEIIKLTNNPLDGWEILECEQLIFECLELFLRPPRELKKKFITIAQNVYQNLRVDQSDTRLNRMIASDSMGKSEISSSIKTQLPINEVERRLKLLIIASLSGISSLYHNRNKDSYQNGWKYVNAIHKFIKEELPKNRSPRRESFALIGLTSFLAGQMARTQTLYMESESFFKEAIEAYSESVIQNEKDFRKLESPTSTQNIEYHEKKVVNLRRGALVNCLGLGYLYLITGQLTKGIDCVTYSRAVLREVNSGAFNHYSDLIYFSLIRAKHSDKEEVIVKVIDGLKHCCDEFKKLLIESHYEARSRLEMALALKYRADFLTSDNFKQKHYNEALTEVEKVRNFARTKKNYHLLSEALHLSSHLLRLQPKPDLKIAERHALQAVKHAENYPQLYPDALLALSAVYTAQAKIHQKNKVSLFEENVKKALDALKDCRQINKKHNPRVSGMTNLRSSKIFSMTNNQNNIDSRAFYFLDLWKKESENIVEHEFCHRFARDLENELLHGGNLLVIGNPKNLDYQKWKNELQRHLAEISVENLAKEDLSDENRNIHFRNANKLDSALVQHIMNRIINDLGKEVNAHKLIEEYKLDEKYLNFFHLESGK